MEKKKVLNLLNKWNDVINYKTAAPIKESKKAVVAMMLENQMNSIDAKMLNEAGQFNTASDIAGYDTILIPLLRRVAPDLIALDVLGVQPMEKPSQLIFAMRAHYAGNDANGAFPYDNANPSMKDNFQMLQVVDFETYNATDYVPGTICVDNLTSPTKYGKIIHTERDDNLGRLTVLIARADNTGKIVGEAGVGTITEPMTRGDQFYKLGTTPTAQTPLVVFDLPDEALFNAVFQNYSGAYGQSMADGWSGNGNMPGAGGIPRDYSERMGTEINQMNISIDKVSVEAMTRILKARYSFETAEDLKSYHGLDAEAELINVLSYEILAEMNREVVDQLRLAAITGGVSSYNYTDVDGRWSQERFRTLFNLINKLANQIAISTRRGNGNFIICSMNVKTALESLDGYELWTDVTKSFNANSAVAYAGTLSGRYKVYVDLFATRDYALIGYKGDSEMDAGMFYCPYVPLSLVRAVGENDFQPRLGFRTRYGIAPNPFGSKLYYRYLDISGLDFAFGEGSAPVLYSNV